MKMLIVVGVASWFAFDHPADKGSIRVDEAHVCRSRTGTRKPSEYRTLAFLREFLVEDSVHEMRVSLNEAMDLIDGIYGEVAHSALEIRQDGVFDVVGRMIVSYR
jgi:hypothetical protein